MQKWFFICLNLVVLLFSTSTSWANGKQQLDQLTSQVPILWQAYRPLCIMGLEADKQLRVDDRLQILDTQMTGLTLKDDLQNTGAPVLTSVWQKPAWQRMAILEKQALQPEQREALREYYFKLQTNKPNEARQDLIIELQQTAQQLNLALREGIWKTCYALGTEGLAEAQLEASLDNRWKKQRKQVVRHLEKELSAFFFYSYRQISNRDLQQYAELQLNVQPWTEAMGQAIKQYFAALRQQMVNQPLAAVKDSVDEPFPANRPWTPAPSQLPLQP